MPNSLKCKIKHLCHNGTITERERDRLLRALEQEPKHTRQEENNELIEFMTKNAENKPEDNMKLIIFQLGAIATMLADISKSLAIIATKSESEEGKE